MGREPISAKLFCKCSYIAFMPYWLVSKDERRTSNVQRRMKTNTKYRTFNSYFCFFSAVLILVTKILIHSSVSSKISFFMIRTENSNSLSSRSYLCFVIFFLNHHSLFKIGFFIHHSMLDVRCSTCPQCLETGVKQI